MPTTVDDFIKKFSGSGTMDEQQAKQYYDRFASTRPEDSQFDTQALHRGATEYLGQVPDNQFHQAAQNAFSQAPPAQRQGLLSSLIGSLTGHGLDMGALGSQLGLQSTNPATMGATDYSRLANFARLNHPEAMQDHVQSQPWLLKAMGNPFVLGALGMVATKMLHRS